MKNPAYDYDATDGNPYDSAPDNDVSVLGPTLVIKGELSAEEDLLIQGRVEGSIDHTKTLTIDDKGVVKADIKAKNIKIQGQVEGNMYGTQSVMIRESGNVVGDVYSPIVTLLEGAKFKGAIDMDADVEAAAKEGMEGRSSRKGQAQARQRDTASAEREAKPSEAKMDKTEDSGNKLQRAAGSQSK